MVYCDLLILLLYDSLCAPKAGAWAVFAILRDRNATYGKGFFQLISREAAKI